MADTHFAVGKDHGKDVFRCLLCRYDGLSKTEIERHMQVIHKVGVPPVQPTLPITEETLSTVEGLVGTGLAAGPLPLPELPLLTPEDGVEEPNPPTPINGVEEPNPLTPENGVQSSRPLPLTPQGGAQFAAGKGSEVGKGRMVNKTARAEKGEK